MLFSHGRDGTTNNYLATDCGLEELPHVRGQGPRPGGAAHIQGAVAAQAPEGLKEPFHVEGQEGRQ